VVVLGVLTNVMFTFVASIISVTNSSGCNSLPISLFTAMGVPWGGIVSSIMRVEVNVRRPFFMRIWYSPGVFMSNGVLPRAKCAVVVCLLKKWEGWTVTPASL